MLVPLSDAEGCLTDLVRRAEAGDEVILTRDGKAAVRLVPVEQAITLEERRAVLDEVWQSARAAKLARGDDGGPDAARSQDFLYDEYGLPK